MLAPAHSGSCELQADLKHYVFVGFCVGLQGSLKPKNNVIDRLIDRLIDRDID
jgi:hypothetical protein